MTRTHYRAIETYSSIDGRLLDITFITTPQPQEPLRIKSASYLQVRRKIQALYEAYEELFHPPLPTMPSIPITPLGHGYEAQKDTREDNTPTQGIQSIINQIIRDNPTMHNNQ